MGIDTIVTSGAENLPNPNRFRVVGVFMHTSHVVIERALVRETNRDGQEA
jgi:hypothetical protein